MAAPFDPGPGGFTVLRCGRGKLATKEWTWNRTVNQWLKRTYSAGMWFTFAEENAASLEDMAASIVRIAADPTVMLIRGALLPERRAALSPGGSVRRIKSPNADAFFTETPRSWAMIDIDGFAMRPSDDLADDPESAIVNAIAELLPAPFQDARCFFQLSASAVFVPRILKAHLFYWLTAPVTDVLLKAVMKQCAPRLADYSVFQGVQPHFVANPVINGAPDPLPRRFGWIDGNDAVILPALVKDPPKARTHGTAGASHVVGNEVEDILARFGDGAGRDGFHLPLLLATMAYAKRCLRYGGRDDEAMKKLLTKTITDAPRGPSRASVDEYLVDRTQQQAIDGAVAKLLSKGAGEHHDVAPHCQPATGSITEARKVMDITIGDFLSHTVQWHSDRADAARAARKAAAANATASEAVHG